MYNFFDIILFRDLNKYQKGDFVEYEFFKSQKCRKLADTYKYEAEHTREHYYDFEQKKKGKSMNKEYIENWLNKLKEYQFNQD